MDAAKRTYAAPDADTLHRSAAKRAHAEPDADISHRTVSCGPTTAADEDGAKRTQEEPSADILHRHHPADILVQRMAADWPGDAEPRHAEIRGFFRARDAVEAGLHHRQLQRMLESGEVERLARGLYRFTDADLTEHHTVAAICARVPNAVVCLLTALNVHNLGTQLPVKVWVAIPHKARTPRLPELPVRVVRFSAAALDYGVVDTVFEGVPARVTDPARTVVDCFRLRHLIGYDVALEALRDALFDRKATASEIRRTAEIFRARSLIRPVMEVMSSWAH